MGLLDRARDSQVPVNGTGDDFLQKLHNLEKGVDYPVVLFQQLINHLSIEKAAVFLKSDSDDSFNCLSSKGYDKTTTNRLRMDRHTIETTEFTSMLEQKNSLVTSQATHFLKEYMSSREFGLIEEIHWLPFFHENRIICIIMISQWHNFVPDDWQNLFNNISSRFSQNVFNSRKALVVQGNTNVRRPGKVELLDKLKALAGKDVYIIEVDLSPLIKMLMNIKEGLSMLHLKKEILSVFRTMAGPQQELIDLGNNKVLLILDKQRVPDKSLFIHQLSASLPLLFQDLETSPVLSTRDFDFPATEEEQDELIRALM
ncbi:MULTISPECIES: hypothetical protein [unclassified Oceanispirochaeta]|uniref:hypothetical protein n=1 Tax=unclassified Oceanispirochaeta TaxID=2635722 RepID=UPI000E093BA0|nr:MULTISPECIES: hypothetical protein [unclassified Oceanispirochaeta]MBF9015596.1 hypothetical protein [Oceanispirochaeta sp. M2]NPD73915.1 hypothetical protein [Oceanispirochaeta sp. M1]RDG30228.1 hypothetical protein DV872_17620 [Oceanispirochaeta sp. M1]